MVTRTVNKILLRDLFTQISTSQASTVTQSYLDQIQSFNGASDSPQSLSAVISNLSTSFSNLSGQPDSGLLQSQTLIAAQQVASKFNGFSSLMLQMRSQTENADRGRHRHDQPGADQHRAAQQPDPAPHGAGPVDCGP